MSSTKAASFATYSGRKRKNVCPRCGTEGPSEGQVAVLLRKLGPNGAMTGGEQLASRSRSLCEKCSVAVYEHVLSAIEPLPTTK